MPRAHLIMNPEARKVTPAQTRVVAAALEARFKLEVTETHARDAGIEVARRAVEDGAEYVIAFGGDGLVNEVVNGMAGADVVMGIIPGGTMNVFARNLGIPRGAVEAADLILEAVDGAGTTVVEIPAANDRLFTFACGCGFDAEAASLVENHKAAKRMYGEPFFYGAALATLIRSYVWRKPYLEVSGPFGRHQAVLAIALNGGRYAYLAGKPVRLLPTQPAPGNVGIFVLESMDWWRLPGYVTATIGLTGYGSRSRAIGDVDAAIIESDVPFPIHVDGEPLVPAARVQIRPGVSQVKVIV